MNAPDKAFSPSLEKPAGFDYLGWAKRPGSSLAMAAVMDCAKRGDERFVEILADLKAQGVCDEDGHLLKRWCPLNQTWFKA